VPWDAENAPAVTSEIPLEETRGNSVATYLLGDIPADADCFIRTQFNMVLTPFVITKYGFIRVRARLDDEAIELGALKVDQQPA